MKNRVQKTMSAGIPALFVLLSGCASAPQTPQPQRAQEEGGSATARLMIAEIALQRGDYPTAAREYSNVSYLVSDPELAEQATRVAFEHRQDTMAAQSARRWLALSPQSEDARRHVAVLSLRLFEVQEAVHHFGHLLTHGYDTPAEGFLDLTGLLAEEESAYAVLALMDLLAQRHAQTPEAHYAVGAAALRAHDYARAQRAARRALELKPDYIDAERLLGRALLVGGEVDAALALARERAAGGDPQARLEVGVLLAAAGPAGDARAALEPLLQLPGTKIEALRTLANLEMSEDDLDAAAGHYTELLTTGRYVSLAFYSLGAIHERRREPVRAIRYYTRVTGGPYASDAQLRAARLLVANGARDQANLLLDTFVGENPAHRIEVAIGRARMLADEGDSGAALRVLSEVSRVYPDVQELHYARGVILEQAGRVNDTIAELRTALLRRPEDPVALNAFGYTLAEHKRNLREAEALILQALEKTPDNPAVQDSMGWVLHRLGRHEEALGWLQRAWAGQQDAEIAAHIGEVHWAMGDRSSAREIWQAALSVEPNHRYLLRTLRRYPD
jgi:tetratricopeptide (TPR) repeat protein